ncbi:MAG: hypothetical protein RR859_09270, partial [Ruthenibacterium sp.]
GATQRGDELFPQNCHIGIVNFFVHLSLQPFYGFSYLGSRKKGAKQTGLSAYYAKANGTGFYTPF